VWRQEQAFEESQKYKEGKFIIEKAKMTKVRPGQLVGRVEVRHGSILSRGLCDGRRREAGDPIRIARSRFYIQRQRHMVGDPVDFVPLSAELHSDRAEQAQAARTHTVVTYT
jgi:hypothetical protein